MWGLRTEEVEGQHIMNLDIGLPVDQLKPCIKKGLAGDSDYQELSLNATNRRGRAIECRIICTPLKSKSDGIRGAILLMEERETEKSK